ncbi:MAG TPA: DUF433 domain-containing protein [Gemmatimonadales bacterium]|nr:DUF433 domain-containing protein [Gemmatimonadales bacterium]
MPLVKGSTAAIRNDRRNQPAYPLAEAARYLKLSPATLRTWVVGRDYPTARGTRHFEPLIVPAEQSPPQLSFWNLIEAHVLWGLRTDHRVPIKAVREALDFAERELGIERLLLRKELCTSARQLFLDKYGELIELSPSHQFAMKQIFDSHLQRVEWDEWQFPVRLFPFMSSEVAPSEPSITIDPGIAFGRPTLRGRGITTEVLADRIDAGESIEEVAADYGIAVAEVEQAILYERAA